MVLNREDVRQYLDRAFEYAKTLSSAGTVGMPRGKKSRRPAVSPTPLKRRRVSPEELSNALDAKRLLSKDEAERQSFTSDDAEHAIVLSGSDSPSYSASPEPYADSANEQSGTYSPSYSASPPHDQTWSSHWWSLTRQPAAETFANFDGENPFFDEMYPELVEKAKADSERRAVDFRNLPTTMEFYAKNLVGKYALSAPLPEELRAIAATEMPIAEVGAGSGYWARCLYRIGCDVVASDKQLALEPYFPIVRADAAEFARRNALSRALMLIWPSYNSTWSNEAVEAYAEAGGSCVIYVGERAGGCTGTDEFFEYLSKAFEAAYTLGSTKRSCDGFGWHNEYLQFWVRKGRPAVKESIEAKITAWIGPDSETFCDMLKRATEAVPDSVMIKEWHVVC